MVGNGDMGTNGKNGGHRRSERQDLSDTDPQSTRGKMEIASFAEEHVQLYVTVVDIIIMVKVGRRSKCKSPVKVKEKKK